MMLMRYAILPHYYDIDYAMMMLLRCRHFDAAAADTRCYAP